ncbi:hypothetical protein AB4Z32_21765 [Massilia sp. 2TAF26]|uniref:hypothetical protein n=1 Tax=Massilia sp. 2TAF26 TaxID=3233012 RepID=UPI003F9CAE9F
MKNMTAILIAGLFAGAAFAQTAPAPVPGQTTTPDSSTSPEVAKAAAAHEKDATKDAKSDARQKKDAAKPATGKGKGKSKPTRAKIKVPPDNGHTSKEDPTA